jgi:tetratricopeptide (TPR) repeat protein
VIRANGAGSSAGLVPGDVIVQLGATPIASVADLRTSMQSIQASKPIDLQVTTPAGPAKSATITPALVPDTLPMRDTSLVYNRLLLDLQDLFRNARSPIEQAAAHLNLGIVHMRLGNWDDAIRELQQVKVSDGPGVSAATVSYLLGITFESLGRLADAQAALTRAAAADQARLSEDGPLVAPLAQQKLRALKP